MRLEDIMRWAGEDGSPAAEHAQQMAAQCLQHTIDRPIHREKVLRAWARAERVHTHPGLPPEEKEGLWNACADELTHATDGS
jgi:hypothetical protein